MPVTSRGGGERSSVEEMTEKKIHIYVAEQYSGRDPMRIGRFSKIYI